VAVAATEAEAAAVNEALEVARAEANAAAKALALAEAEAEAEAAAAAEAAAFAQAAVEAAAAAEAETRASAAAAAAEAAATAAAEEAKVAAEQRLMTAAKASPPSRSPPTPPLPAPRGAAPPPPPPPLVSTLTAVASPRGAAPAPPQSTSSEQRQKLLRKLIAARGTIAAHSSPGSRRFGGWVASTPHWIRATAAEAFVIFCSVGNTNTSQSNGWGQETIIALAGTFNAACCATRKSRPRFPDTTTTAAAARYDDAGDGADEKPSLAPNASNPWCKVGGHHLTATGEAAQCQRKVCF